MRICSLLPSGTEILYSLGLGDQIVAVSDDCDVPAEVKKKPIVSKSVLAGKGYSSSKVHRVVEEHRHTGLSLYDIREDFLQKLKPDLIITQELCEVCAIPYSQVLKAAKVLDESPKIISLEPRTLGDILDNIILVGRITASKAKAEKLVRALRARIEAVKSRARNVSRRPRVLCVEWVHPLMAGGHWVPEMVEIAGGVDDMVEPGDWSAKLDWSKVLEYRPEVIVVMPCSYSLEESLKEARSLEKLDEWKTLPAVRDDRVHAVNAKWYFSRSGPGLVTGLEIMGAILHPELFDGMAPPESVSKVRTR